MEISSFERVYILIWYLNEEFRLLFAWNVNDDESHATTKVDSEYNLFHVLLLYK